MIHKATGAPVVAGVCVPTPCAAVTTSLAGLPTPRNAYWSCTSGFQALCLD